MVSQSWLLLVWRLVVEPVETLVNYGFYFVSKSLKNFVSVNYRFWLFGVLASSVFYSLPKSKLCVKVGRVGGGSGFLPAFW